MGEEKNVTMSKNVNSPFKSLDIKKIIFIHNGKQKLLFGAGNLFGVPFYTYMHVKDYGIHIYEGLCRGVAGLWPY